MKDDSAKGMPAPQPSSFKSEHDGLDTTRNTNSSIKRPWDAMTVAAEVVSRAGSASIDVPQKKTKHDALSDVSKHDLVQDVLESPNTASQANQDAPSPTIHKKVVAAHRTSWSGDNIRSKASPTADIGSPVVPQGGGEMKSALMSTIGTRLTTTSTQPISPMTWGGSFRTAESSAPYGLNVFSIGRSNIPLTGETTGPESMNRRTESPFGISSTPAASCWLPPFTSHRPPAVSLFTRHSDGGSLGVTRVFSLVGIVRRNDSWTSASNNVEDTIQLRTIDASDNGDARAETAAGSAVSLTLRPREVAQILRVSSSQKQANLTLIVHSGEDITLMFARESRGREVRAASLAARQFQGWLTGLNDDIELPKAPESYRYGL